jgi:hypothetical protein
MNLKQQFVRKSFLRIPAILVFLWMLSLLSLGQQPVDHPKPPQVTLGLPKQLEPQIRLWDDAETQKPRDITLLNVSVPTDEVDRGGEAPQTELAQPRVLYNLPPPPAVPTGRVAKPAQAKVDHADHDLLLGAILEDDSLLITGPKVSATETQDATAAHSSLDAIPVELFGKSEIKEFALPIPRTEAQRSPGALQEMQGERQDRLLPEGSPRVDELPRPSTGEIESTTETPVGNAGESDDSQSFEDLLPLSIYEGVGAGVAGQSPSGYTLPRVSSAKPGPVADTPTDSLKADDKGLIQPEFFVAPTMGPEIGMGTQRIPFQFQDFCPSVPVGPSMLDPWSEELIYRGKYAVPTQRPLIEWGKPFYSGGIFPPGNDLLGPTNLIRPHLFVYGDFRTGVGVNRNANGDAHNLASRLNLDIDFALTATERIHAFTGPLDRTGDFTRFDFTDSAEIVNRMDMRFDTLFFEGDLGSILGGLNGVDSTFDLPFTFGFLPLIYQNGIWANDAIIGAAVALPARHSRVLNWSNYDATFFWASDQVTTDAFLGDNNAAEFFGSAWFIDAYGGYIEANYAFVNDDVSGNRSYHNMAFAFTRRYHARLSNSIRFISNVGQDLPSDQRTADGHLLLLENSLISSSPNTFVPYCNLFYGQGRPQSLARAAGTGGVLNNVGINFETDGLTGYPNLDFTGHNAYGGALGVNWMASDFSQQLILEAALVNATGSTQFRNAPGDQFAIGMRYQRPLSNAWLFRTDHMYGWRNHVDDLRGSRFELRWKF